MEKEKSNPGQHQHQWGMVKDRGPTDLEEGGYFPGCVKCGTPLKVYRRASIKPISQENS